MSEAGIDPGLRVHTVLIDGPSGSGKSSFARALGRAWSMQVVALDDFYPGWAGLAAGSQMVADDVLAAKQPGFWRWDWHRGVRSSWEPLDPAAALIVEGVGAITPDSLAAARRRGGGVLSVFVDAPAQLRRSRAVQRDPGFAEYWQMWAQQEESYFSSAAAKVHRRVDVRIFHPR